MISVFEIISEILATEYFWSSFGQVYIIYLIELGNVSLVVKSSFVSP